MTDLATVLAQKGNADHIAATCATCGRSAVVTDWRHLCQTGWHIAVVTRLMRHQLVQERIATGLTLCSTCRTV